MGMEIVVGMLIGYSRLGMGMGIVASVKRFLHRTRLKYT